MLDWNNWKLRILRAQGIHPTDSFRDSMDTHIRELLLTVWTVRTCSNWRWRGIPGGSCAGLTRAHVPIICQRPLWSLSWVHFILSLGLRHHITHGIWQKPQQIEKIKINFYSWTFRSCLRSLKRPLFLLVASWVIPRCASWYSKGSCHSMLDKQHG